MTQSRRILVRACVTLAPVLHILHLTRSEPSCETSRSENPDIGNCEHQFNQTIVFNYSITAQQCLCLYMVIDFYLCAGSWIVKGPCYRALTHQSPHCPACRMEDGIEAKRLIALMTAIGIHLKTSLETKWWFFNSEADLDIWLSKQSYPLRCLCECLWLCVHTRTFFHLFCNRLTHAQVKNSMQSYMCLLIAAPEFVKYMSWQTDNKNIHTEQRRVRWGSVRSHVGENCPKNRTEIIHSRR